MTLLATLTDLYAHVGDGEVEPPLEPALLPDVEDLPVEGRGARGHAVVAHYPTLQHEHRKDSVRSGDFDLICQKTLYP